MNRVVVSVVYSGMFWLSSFPMCCWREAWVSQRVHNEPMGVVIGVAVLILVGALVHFIRRIGDRIAYGSGPSSTTSIDAISAAQYDRKIGDVSGLGGM